MFVWMVLAYSQARPIPPNKYFKPLFVCCMFWRTDFMLQDLAY